MMGEATNTVTFADFAGCEDAEEDVPELFYFLRYATKFQNVCA